MAGRVRLVSNAERPSLELNRRGGVVIFVRGVRIRI